MRFPDQTKPIEEQDEDVLLAMLVWGEARGEPPEGMSAVAHVALTRMMRLKKRFHSMLKRDLSGSLKRVILRPWQFSCFNEKDPNRAKLLRPVECEGLGLWAACWRAASEALLGQSANPAQGATHYCVRRLWARPAVDASRPQWFEAPAIAAGKTTFVAAIGSHIFARSA